MTNQVNFVYFIQQIFEKLNQLFIITIGGAVKDLYYPCQYTECIKDNGYFKLILKSNKNLV